MEHDSSLGNLAPQDFPNLPQQVVDNILKVARGGNRDAAMTLLTALDDQAIMEYRAAQERSSPGGYRGEMEPHYRAALQIAKLRRFIDCII